MKETKSQDDPVAIAVIGMAGRFPGANDVDQFWENLKNGVESIRRFSADELRLAGVEAAELDNPNYIRAKPVLSNVEFFDAGFFGFSPREAEILDPQHRVFLECCWEALENAACDPAQTDDRIGVFAGATRSTYLLAHDPKTELSKALDPLQLLLSNNPDYLTTRVSYKLDLKGPSISVNTACSTSLVAVCLGCQSLLNHESDILLAGGITISLPQVSGYFYQEGVLFSPDGHCRAFDAGARGTIFGNGAGVVVLKRLEDARAAGDHIHAVIRGFAINNDGAVKVGFTAPSVDGQADVIANALGLAAVDARTIGYVEAHGTGTRLGDPIEVAALTRAYRLDRSTNNYCLLGSVKSNVGHLNAAAGVTGLIKAILALKNAQVPATLHFENPNPVIDFPNTPFRVNNMLAEWPESSAPRRAGVSSFGVGGTNAHVILEEAPPRSSGSTVTSRHLLLLSARTSGALAAATKNLVGHLTRKPGVEMADVAHTLRTGRRAFSHRRMLVCCSAEDAIRELTLLDPGRVVDGTAQEGASSIAFLFPGQGAQQLGMGRQLYGSLPTFRRNVDDCAGLIEKLSDIDVREPLFHSETKEEAVRTLNRTQMAQIALFVVEYSLARTWLAWGIRPSAMLGHSVGEYVCACLSGVFSLEEGLSLILERGRLMQSLEPGAMVAVELSESDAARYCSSELSIAAVNAPFLCVLSGPGQRIEELERKLDQEGVAHRRLRTSHAFHSKMMEPILDAFTEFGHRIELRSPEIPYISNITGDWVRSGEVTEPSYWSRHLRSTVRFSDGVRRLLESDNLITLEVGPGNTLANFVKRHTPANGTPITLNSLPRVSSEQDEEEFLLGTVGRLWCAGVNPRWEHFYASQGCRRVPLPTYPFERQRYWIDSTATRSAHSREEKTTQQDGLGHALYQPVWQRRSAFPRQAATLPPQNWLIFLDGLGVGAGIAAELRRQHQNVCTVTQADEFRKIGSTDYGIDPQSLDHLSSLLRELDLSLKSPQRIVHLWGLGFHKGDFELGELGRLYACGIHTILDTIRLLGSQTDRVVHLDVVTNNTFKVVGESYLCPEKATIVGACRVIPREYDNIPCRALDISLTDAACFDPLADGLFEELLSEPSDPVVALRGKERWIQTFVQQPVGSAQALSPCFRARGVYLITGGLGGLGLVIAKYLAEKFRARLILSGRSSFPPMSAWDDWLDSHDESDAVSGKIRALRRIQQLGGEVHTLEANVADLEEMRLGISKAQEQFGPINGVIHCAGIADGALIRRRRREHTEAVLTAKVAGTMVLDKIFKDESLDCFILSSSLSTLLGFVGQAGYVAGNAFLDAFANARSGQDYPRTISIGWDAWADVGMAAEGRRSANLTNLLGGVPLSDLSEELLDRCVTDDFDTTAYLSLLSPKKHWILREHKILGKATLPGTAFLEMAREAIKQRTGAKTIEIRDVYFLHPFTVEETEEKQVKIVLEPRGKEFAFSILSQASQSEDSWSEHAKGVIGRVNSRRPRRRIPKLLSGVVAENPSVDRPETEQLFTFGPRWHNVERLSIQAAKGAAVLELPAAYVGDLSTYQLHPALLDSATAFLATKLANEPCLPYRYERIRIWGPLPKRVLSYVVLRSDSSFGKTLTFDVRLTDEHGNCLVDIKGYTLRKGRDLLKDALPHKEKEGVQSNWCLGFTSPGVLDSLRYSPALRRPPASGEIEILVETTGLNFKDVLFALGMLPPPDSGIALGMECSGRVARIGEDIRDFKIGDRVVAFAAPSFSSYVTTPGRLAARVPDNLTAAQAVTIPVAFLTAYYSLMKVGKLEAGERVLIHAASGAVGLAAINVARWVGAEIFATAGSEEKRRFLRSRGVTHLYDSRSLAFAKEIMRDTDGQGVDVVLNSLTGQFIPESLKLLAPFGRFLEIGIRDILTDRTLSLRTMANNISFSTILLSPSLPKFESIWSELMEHVRAEHFQPLPYTLFPASDTAKAFQYMTTRKHVGKIVVGQGDTDKTNASTFTFRLEDPSHHIGGAANAPTNGNELRGAGLASSFERWKENALSVTEGEEIFARITSSIWPQVLVSKENLQQRLQKTRILTVENLQLAARDASAAREAHPRPSLKTEYVAPRTPTQSKLTEIWGQHLGIEGLGIHDDFFELGGDSLLAAQVYGVTRDVFGVEPDIDSLFEKPTVAAIAEVIDRLRSDIADTQQRGPEAPSR